MKARTVPWESIADWYKEHEQAIRDIMKFEGLRGIVNEVLRLAPEQPEIATLREELVNSHQREAKLQDMVTAAEQRNADLVNLLKRCRTNLTANKGSAVELNLKTPISDRLLLDVEAALKPTESGASE